MRLIKARIQKYRSIRDTGFFDVEEKKTILVGPNEAGKSAILQALQQLNPPSGIKGFEALRDYPRSELNDLDTGKVKPEEHTVVEGHFGLEDKDKALIPSDYHGCALVRGRRLDNTVWHKLEGAPSVQYGDLRKDLSRLVAHVEGRLPATSDTGRPHPLPSVTLATINDGWPDSRLLTDADGVALSSWLQGVYRYVSEGDSVEEERFRRLEVACKVPSANEAILASLTARVPVFVLFSNYFRVKPLIHLSHLASRIEQNILDGDQYDYGNQCLLTLLGFTARDLSNLGKAAEPAQTDKAALQAYRDQLDKRAYKLNAASVRLSEEIRSVWVPDEKKDEADSLRVVADGQYLKVVVEDDLGVEIELDQRSEGFQWLVSFFVVFFAEAQGKHENAVLLLDEPGLSLHGLKQREFRTTVSRLAEKNQALYTTHSPFLVGPGELDFVRVVEMPDRRRGTIVHNDVTSEDPAALLPLQEALGYDLAQSLFAQERNLVLEGLTDYWYVEAVAALLRDASTCDLDERTALVPAQSAGKVVYFATILHAHNLKVAALLDSDSAGDQAATQEVLVHTLGNKRILRTKDVYSGAVTRPEIEDLLRDTLLHVAKSELSWDVTVTASSQPARPLVDIFEAEIAGFSKYRLAKAFLRWSRDHGAKDFTTGEREGWRRLIEMINTTLA